MNTENVVCVENAIVACSRGEMEYCCLYFREISFIVLSFREGRVQVSIETLLVKVHVFFWKTLVGSLLKCYQSLLTFWDCS